MSIGSFGDGFLDSIRRYSAHVRSQSFDNFASGLAELAANGKIDKLQPKLTPQTITSLPPHILGSILIDTASDEARPCFELILASEAAKTISQKDLDDCVKKLAENNQMLAAVALLSSESVDRLSTENLESFLSSAFRTNNAELANLILSLPQAYGISDDLLHCLLQQSVKNNQIYMLLLLLKKLGGIVSDRERGNIYIRLIINGCPESAEKLALFIISEHRSPEFFGIFLRGIECSVQHNDFQSLQRLCMFYLTDCVRCKKEKISFQLVDSLEKACISKDDIDLRIPIIREILNFIGDLDVESLTECEKLKVKVSFWESKIGERGKDIVAIFLNSALTTLINDIYLDDYLKIDALITDLRRQIEIIGLKRRLTQLSEPSSKDPILMKV